MNAQSLIKHRKDPTKLPKARLLKPAQVMNQPHIKLTASPSYAQSSHTPVGRLSQQEFRRRLWHFSPGFGAIILTTIPRLDPLPLETMICVVLLGIVIPSYLAIRFHKLFRRHAEEDAAPSILGYAIPITVMCMLFRSHVELPFTTAAIIAFGDGSATLCGLLFGGEKLAWNPRKSWAGLYGFMVFGTILGTLVYWLGADQEVAMATCLMCVAPAVLVCALMESIPSRYNDNLIVGVSAAVMLVLMQTLVVGW